jgi:lysylphosphatidylglycerol synthetase-like protein (DUF2156 family)
VVAALGYGLSRRSGPAWLGVVTSLKAVPALFGLVYVARREWRHAVVSAIVAVVFSLPYLLYDLSGYETDPGASYSFYYYVSPMAWIVTALASTTLAVWLALRRSPYVWVAAAMAVMLAAPRTHVTYATYLLVGLLAGGRDVIGPRHRG